MASISKLLRILPTWAFPLLYIASAVLFGLSSMEHAQASKRSRESCTSRRGSCHPWKEWGNLVLKCGPDQKLDLHEGGPPEVRERTVKVDSGLPALERHLGHGTFTNSSKSSLDLVEVTGASSFEPAGCCWLSFRYSCRSRSQSQAKSVVAFVVISRTLASTSTTQSLVFGIVARRRRTRKRSSSN